MKHVAGIPRQQLVLFPESLDEYIAADNSVRFIDAFVDSLDLAAAGFAYTSLAETERPPYDPRDLLKLYLYGYLNRVRSSRKLEIETYLKELDELDRIEAPDVPPQRSGEQLQAKIEQLKTRQVKYQGYLKRMEESGESQLSLTDPDSRSMPKSPKAPVAYNVQTAVDSKHHLIVAQDVTNDVTDRDQLSRMAVEANLQSQT